jgi:coronin-1B/1C/6
MLPKRVVNVNECEVTRLLKLTTSTVEPLRFIIPRKSDLFQSDIFPDARAPKAALSSDAFFDGKNANPVLMSLDPKKRTDAPAEAAVAMKAVKSSADTAKDLEHALARIAQLEALLTKNHISF